jgi:hypothetical protein
LVALLAGVNPEPVISRVLQAYLPEYDPDEDYIIDKAVQTIGRGSIRSSNSTERMMAIVPTYELALRLVNRMSGYPLIDLVFAKKMGDYVWWSKKEYQSKSQTFDEKYPKYRAFSSKINYQKSKLKKNPNDVKIKQKIEQLMAARESYVRECDHSQSR